MLWVRISIRERCTTLCNKVCQWLATGWWFYLGPPVSSTNETDPHDITEILLKVVVNTLTITLTNLTHFFHPSIINHCLPLMIHFLTYWYWLIINWCRFHSVITAINFYFIKIPNSCPTVLALQDSVVAQ
jgi:hypothetical protein